MCSPQMLFGPACLAKVTVVFPWIHMFNGGCVPSCHCPTLPQTLKLNSQQKWKTCVHLRCIWIDCALGKKEVNEWMSYSCSFHSNSFSTWIGQTGDCFHVNEWLGPVNWFVDNWLALSSIHSLTDWTKASGFITQWGTMDSNELICLHPKQNKPNQTISDRNECERKTSVLAN